MQIRDQQVIVMPDGTRMTIIDRLPSTAWWCRLARAPV